MAYQPKRQRRFPPVNPSPSPSPIDLMAAPSVTDWVGALGTAGALLVALFVLSMDVRARRQETSRQRLQDADRRREQASNVSGLIVEGLNDQPRQPGPVANLFAIVHNGSGRPIYKPVGLVKDALTGESVRTIGFPDVLPGGHRVQEDVIDLLALHPPATNHFLLEVGFTDAAGLRWNRHADGSLQQQGPV